MQGLALPSFPSSLHTTSKPLNRILFLSKSIAASSTSHRRDRLRAFNPSGAPFQDLGQSWVNHQPIAAMNPVAEVAGIEAQVLYLGVLAVLLSGGAYLVVRQALIRRELDQTAKSLGESIRSGKGGSEDYFELAAILIRKKLYTQAMKNLEKTIALWDGNESDLAQVYNAFGYCLFSTGRVEESIEEYLKAVKFQPGYTTAWNNLGDAYEQQTKLRDAYNAYQKTLSYAPDNKIALQRSEYLEGRLERLQL